MGVVGVVLNMFGLMVVFSLGAVHLGVDNLMVGMVLLLSSLLRMVIFFC